MPVDLEEELAIESDIEEEELATELDVKVEATLTFEPTLEEIFPQDESVGLGGTLSEESEHVALPEDESTKTSMLTELCTLFIFCLCLIPFAWLVIAFSPILPRVNVLRHTLQCAE